MFRPMEILTGLVGLVFLAAAIMIVSGLLRLLTVPKLLREIIGHIAEIEELLRSRQ